MCLNKDLLNLMKKNPNLPVLFIVNNKFETIKGVQKNFSRGKVNNLFISEYAKYRTVNNSYYFLKRNIEAKENLTEAILSELTESEREEVNILELENIVWHKAIFIEVQDLDNSPVL